MIDYLSLIKHTSPYKVMKSDKMKGTLSHAYLIISADKDNMINYLKIFAKLILCEKGFPCDNCATCHQIEKDDFPDIKVYPKDRDKGVLLTEDISSLIEESYYKPTVGDKKVFIIYNAETMNLSAQNKLLKTLEEPPKNVVILLMATSEYPLLPTIKSRVKKLEMSQFSNELLFDALKSDYTDIERLNEAIACGDGTVGKAVDLYENKDFSLVVDLVEDVLVNMKKSSQVLDYSIKVNDSKIDFDIFLSVLELRLNDMLKIAEGRKNLVNDKRAIELYGKLEGFNQGSIIYALEKITTARRQKVANMNSTMLSEWMLFQILEGKHKWLKL